MKQQFQGTVSQIIVGSKTSGHSQVRVRTKDGGEVIFSLPNAADVAPFVALGDQPATITLEIADQAPAAPTA